MEPFKGSSQEWNTLISRLPEPHLLQTWQWSQVKAAFGWQPSPMVWEEGSQTFAAAMILKRRIPVRGLAPRLYLIYIPKGPLLDWQDLPLVAKVLNDLQRYARSQGAIFLKIDPDVVMGEGIPGIQGASDHPGGRTIQADLQSRGWRFSQDQIQFRNTVLLDLAPSEEELLKNMKQKTRYNIRLAGRKGVEVRAGGEQDLGTLFDMYAETAARDGFVIREERYYRTVWETFLRSRSPSCEPLIAEVEGVPVAAIFLFHFAGKAYYLYGMSRDIHREKMPNYLLQWEAIRRAKAAGDLTYDLWGAPEVFDETDGLWGVFRFKLGLGGRVQRTLGAWDYPPRTVLYQLYTQLMPRILGIMRARGMTQTRRSIGA
jgi:lipid II:glycine glycyltransferase (peptidoglycan interpeptide bridge formation enzyme)